MICLKLAPLPMPMASSASGSRLVTRRTCSSLSLLYGDLYRVRSIRWLEADCSGNLEVMWLPAAEELSLARNRSVFLARLGEAWVMTANANRFPARHRA